MVDEGRFLNHPKICLPLSHILISYCNCCILFLHHHYSWINCLVFCSSFYKLLCSVIQILPACRLFCQSSCNRIYIVQTSSNSLHHSTSPTGILPEQFVLKKTNIFILKSYSHHPLPLGFNNLVFAIWKGTERALCWKTESLVLQEIT